MAIDYPKQQIKAKDRRIVTSGPRDRQMKQQAMYSAEATAKIEALQNKIEALASKTSSKNDGYSADEVNEVVIKAVKEETAKLKDKHGFEKEKLLNKITQLEERIEISTKAYEKELSNLKDVIKIKDELISQIKEMSNFSDNKLTALFKEMSEKISTYPSGDSIDVESDRPKMGVAFVDPIEKDMSVETHIEFDNMGKSDDKLVSKIDKLKDMGFKLK